MILVPLLLLQLAAAKPTEWKVIERTKVAWWPSAPAYELTIEEPIQRPQADEVDSSRIRIRVPGHPDFVFVDDRGSGPFEEIADNFPRDTAAFGKNLLNAKYFLMSGRARGVRGTPLLIVFGYGYASDPGLLVIIGLDARGQPVLLFHREFFLSAITDLDGEGTAELVGKASLSQEFGKCQTTYDPFAVYRVDPSTTPRIFYDVAIEPAVQSQTLRLGGAWRHERECRPLHPRPTQAREAQWLN